MIELAVTGVIVLAVSGLFIPIPPALLDIFVVGNLGLAIFVLILSVSVKDVLQLSSFPAVLLANTIFRICLSVALTRSILGAAQGGKVVEQFGEMVIGGNIVLGLVVYCIIATVQFLVLAKGAERVAEVSARFSLDALPGRQMAIDADVRMGLLDPETAKKKRQELQNESRFFGALDGTMKFVKGDAIAGLIIVVINLIGGLILGIVVLDMEAVQALKKFAVLSVGEGLVSQIPSFLNALAAGFLVSRVEKESETGLGGLIFKQLGGPIAPKVTLGLLCFIFSLTAPVPFWICIVAGAALLISAGFQTVMMEKQLSTTPFKFIPALKPALVLEAPKGFNLVEFLEITRKEIFESTGLIVASMEGGFGDGSALKVIVRGKEVFKKEKVDENLTELAKAVTDSLKPFLHELIDERSISRLFGLYESVKQFGLGENLISTFKAKEIVQALARDEIWLTPIDVALETLVNLPAEISVEDGVEEMRKRLLQYSLAKSSYKVFMFPPEIAIQLEEQLMQGNLLPFEIVKNLKANLDDAKDTLIVCFKNTARYLSRTLAFKHTKVVSTDEVPQEFDIKDCIYLDFSNSLTA